MAADTFDTDSELLKGLKNDLPGAFEEIFNAYWQELYERAYRRLGDQSEAEDLVQEIFTSFWARRYQLEITTSLKGYFSKALKYQIIALASRADIHKRAIDHLLYRMEELEGTILDVLIAKDVKQSLQETIDTFPENMQKVFSLRSQDFSIAEIASALGLAEQTVKNNNTEALRRLKATLEMKHPDISRSFLAALTVLIVN